MICLVKVPHEIKNIAARHDTMSGSPAQTMHYIVRPKCRRMSREVLVLLHVKEVLAARTF